MSQSKFLLPAKEYSMQSSTGTFVRRKVIFVIVLICLVVALLLTVLVSSISSPVVLIATWILVGLTGGWAGMILKDIVRSPLRSTQDILVTCNQLIQHGSDREQLLGRITQVLYTGLKVDSLSVWRFDDDDRVMTLLRVEGLPVTDEFSQLPVDLHPDQLKASRWVRNLPESALKQGLQAAGVQVICSLRVGRELGGMIGLNGSQYPNDLLNRLNILSGQLALLLKNVLLEINLADRQQKLHLAYRRTIDAQDEERRSLATELHDDILGRLTKMALSLHKSQKNLFDNPEVVRDWLANLETEAQNINGRLREITQGLHPSILTDLGLISAVQAYIDSLGRQPAIAGRQTISLTAQGFGEDRIKMPKLERDLYYIIRQALDNALKHAHTEHVFIHLRWDDQGVSVTVRDTGQGMLTQPESIMGQNGRLGLLSMYERTLAWHGKLTFHTAPGQGTTIRARLPVDQPSSAPTHLQAFTQYLN